MKIETKKLDIRPGDKGLKGILKAKQFRKTVTGIVVGAVAGFALFYFTEGIHMNSLATIDILQSLGFGGLFGLFITNSPCARNKC